MFLAQVKGNVVATQKVGQVAGHKLLMVETYTLKDEQLGPAGLGLVAIDTVGAGVGEMVLITQGSSARMTEFTGEMPVDAVIVGIIDTVTIAGKTAYHKE